MAGPSNREEFKQYCLRKLGAPVLRIDVADVQLEDRIDDALQTWYEKHFDATEHKWFAYKVTQDDIDNGFITVPDNFLIVDRVMKLNSVLSGMGKTSQDYNLSYQYQFVINNLSPFAPLDTLNYYLTMTSLNEMDDLLNAEERFVFTRHLNKLNMYNAFQKTLKVDDILSIRVNILLPESNLKIWNDKWLKAYGTAVFKKQWASNLSKFEQIQLLGGITVNGERLYNEALTEIEKLEEELETTYQEPVGFLVG